MESSVDASGRDDDIESLEIDLIWAFGDCRTARLLGSYQRLNWDHFSQRAKALDIDEERLGRISRLAELGFSWSDTISPMLVNGLEMETAEHITDRIFERPAIRKCQYDNALEEAIAETRRTDFRRKLMKSGGYVAYAVGLAALAAWYFELFELPF